MTDEHKLNQVHIGYYLLSVNMFHCSVVRMSVTSQYAKNFSDCVPADIVCVCLFSA